MTISVNWATKVISIEKTDMTLISSSPYDIYQLDVNTFRLALKTLESSTDGMIFLDTHIHTPEITLNGIVYARSIKIINGYTVTFENDAYAVQISNANNNIAEVTTLNLVQLRSSNSAGLQRTSSLEFWNEINYDNIASSAGNALAAVSTNVSTSGLTTDQANTLNIINVTTLASNVSSTQILADIENIDANLVIANTLLSSVNSNISTIDTVVDSVQSDVTDIDTTLNLVNSNITTIDATATNTNIVIQQVLSDVANVSQIAGLTPTQATQLLEVYKIHGLDPTAPLVVTDNSRTANTISQSITGNDAITTVTRT